MQMWARYMDVYGPPELRTVRSTLHWLRTEYIVAARQRVSLGLPSSKGSAQNSENKAR